MKTVRNELYYRLFAEAETKYKNGVHTGSYVEELLKNQQEVGMDRDEMACVLPHSSSAFQSLIQYP